MCAKITDKITLFHQQEGRSQKDGDLLMVTGSCKERIRAKMSQLTETEKKIGGYVLQNYDTVLQCNVSDLAGKSGVSDASVVRFCRSIGYRGFQDFKMNLARDILPPDRQLNPILGRNDTTEEVCRKIFLSEEIVLNRTLLGMNMKDVHTLAEKISEARKVVFFGTGGSQAVCADAHHKFLKVGVDTIAEPDIDMQLMESALMNDQDVGICISFSGSNTNVQECIKNAKSSGAFTAGIISQGKSPLSKLVDVAMFSAYEETIFQSESVSTRIAQLAILDCLVSAVAIMNYDQSYESILNTREATSIGKY